MLVPTNHFTKFNLKEYTAGFERESHEILSETRYKNNNKYIKG